MTPEPIRGNIVQEDREREKGAKMRLRKVFGALLIVLGLGIFCFGEAMLYLTQPIDTDIESIVNGEIPLSKTVRVSGKLSSSDWTIIEREEETGKVPGMEYVYSLSKTSEGKTLSIWVKSDHRLEEGEEVAVTGELLHRAYGPSGYLVEVQAEAPIRWVFVCGMLTLVLLGITLLVLRG